MIGASLAWADDIPVCTQPSGVQTRSFPDQIPAVLLKALNDGYGTFARPGEQFYSTDAHVADEPSRSSRRVIFVWEQGARWIVATEHGGGAYNDPILIYDLDPQNSKASLVKELVALPMTVCDTAKKWVGGNP